MLEGFFICFSEVKVYCKSCNKVFYRRYVRLCICVSYRAYNEVLRILFWNRCSLLKFVMLVPNLTGDEYLTQFKVTVKKCSFVSIRIIFKWELEYYFGKKPHIVLL